MLKTTAQEQNKISPLVSDRKWVHMYINTNKANKRGQYFSEIGPYVQAAD